MLPDKSVYQSWTAWGGLVFATATAAEQGGFLPEGVSLAAVAVVKAVAGLVTLLGIRRVLGQS